MLDRRRAYAPEIFHIPPGEEAAFRSAVEREWPKFLNPPVPTQPATLDDENGEAGTDPGDDS